jgi:hypothetical protein
MDEEPGPALVASPQEAVGALRIGLIEREVMIAPGAADPLGIFGIGSHADCVEGD